MFGIDSLRDGVSRVPQVRQLIRTSEAKPDNQAAVQLAQSFGVDMYSLNRATILVYRSENGLFQAFVGAGAETAVQAAASNLANVIAGKAVPVEDLHERLAAMDEEIDFNQPVGRLEKARVGARVRQAVHSLDLFIVPGVLVRNMPRGSWVAIAMRQPTDREQIKHDGWRQSFRGDAAAAPHHSTEKGAVAATIWASAPKYLDTKRLLKALYGNLPGFDVDSSAKVYSRAGATAPFALAAAASFVGAVKLPQATDVLTSGRPLWILGAVMVLLAVGRWTGKIKSPWSRARRQIMTGRFRKPAAKNRFFLGPDARPEKTDQDGKVIRKARLAAYPYPTSVFQIGPAVIASIAAPTSSASTGETATVSDTVPSKALERIGLMVGHTHDGRPVHVSAADQPYGVAIVGKPGGGKTELVHGFYAWTCLERTRPSGSPGFPGNCNAIIAFESKGDGVPKYLAWAEATGDVITVIDSGDEFSFGIDFFALPDSTARDRADLFVNAMTAGFDDGQILGRTGPTLLAVLTAGQVITPAMASQVKGLAVGESPIYYAFALLGGLGEQMAVDLYKQIERLQLHNRVEGFIGVDQPEPDEDLVESFQLLRPLFERTESQRRTETDAPRRRIQELMNLREWWHPERAKFSFDDILKNHWSVVINTGTPRRGRKPVGKVGDIISAMSMYLLKAAIERNCSGWQARGQSVSLFADELFVLAGSSSEVITWLKDQGRSYGVRPVFATQRPDQLTDAVRTAFINFPTLFSFAQESTVTAQQVAREIDGGQGKWNETHVLNLEPYHAIVRAGIDQRRQDAYVAKIAFFAADMAGFAAMQGYTEAQEVVVAEPVAEETSFEDIYGYPVESTEQPYATETTYPAVETVAPAVAADPMTTPTPAQPQVTNPEAETAWPSPESTFAPTPDVVSPYAADPLPAHEAFAPVAVQPQSIVEVPTVPVAPATDQAAFVPIPADAILDPASGTYMFPVTGPTGDVIGYQPFVPTMTAAVSAPVEGTTE